MSLLSLSSFSDDPRASTRPTWSGVARPWPDTPLHGAVELRLPFRDEDRLDAEPQAQPDDPRQVACRRPPAAQFAGVVQLDLGRPAQVLPAFPEESEDF